MSEPPDFDFSELNIRCKRLTLHGDPRIESLSTIAEVCSGPMGALMVIRQAYCLNSLGGKRATTVRLMRTCRKGECHVWPSVRWLMTSLDLMFTASW